MSHRRSISFTENETDLLWYFDNNGKSDLVKVALRDYMKNRETVLSDKMKVEILKLVGSVNIAPQEKKVNQEIKSKFASLVR